MGLLKRALMAIWITFLAVIWLVGPASYILTHATSPVAWGGGLVGAAVLAICAVWFRGRWRVSARWPNLPFEVLGPFSIVGAIVGVEVLLWLGVKALLR